MKMKKTIFSFVLAAGTAALLSSCIGFIPSTHKMTADINNAVEQNVTVTFTNSNDGWFILKEWNSSAIKDDLYGKKSIKSNDKTVLTVPAGENSFTFDARYTFSNSYSSTTYRMEDIELQYLLGAGKKYQIKGRTKSLGFFKGHELLVGIYDVTKGSTLLKEWKLGET